MSTPRGLDFALAQAVDRYIGDRIVGLAPPIPVLDPAVQARFGVRHLFLGETRLQTPALLSLVRGGFAITSRLSYSRSRDLRFLIAHELAHTFSYTLKGPEQYPVLRAVEQNTEAMANFGARAILMPRTFLSPLIQGDLELPHLLYHARRLDVYPHWLAQRLIGDLELRQAAFFTYDWTRRGLRRKSTLDVRSASTLDRRCLRSIGQQLRRLRGEHQSRWTVSHSRGQSVAVACAEVDGLFGTCRRVYVLVSGDDIGTGGSTC